jgi:DNA polymerase III epsilon subunit-like protein
MNKKDQVLTELFEICHKRNDYVFHNDLVKDISKKVGFGNPFDVTKIKISFHKYCLTTILQLFT